MSQPLVGKHALITGASQGLGEAIAKAYVRAGADVMLCARSAERLEETRARIAAEAPEGVRVLARAADVSKPGEVDALVSAAIGAFGHVDILVNNAGVYGPMGPTESVDWTAWTQAIEINLYGTLLPCRALIPHFKARGHGKIVNLSGGGATNPLPRLSSYAASKAAVVRLTETLAEELKDDHIDVNAVAPGALNTRMLDELLEAGPGAVGAGFFEKMKAIKQKGGTPLEKGAELCVFLGSAASDGITGRLISAVWDPWAELPVRRGQIEGTDIYTLRRIVPRDRGQDWGG